MSAVRLSTWPRATVSACVIGVVMWVGVAWGGYRYQWNDLQRMYLPAYVISAVADALAVPPLRYTFVAVNDARGRRLAGLGEVVLVDGNRWAVTTGGARRGVRTVSEFRSERLQHAGVNDLLRRSYYRGQSPIRMLEAASWVAGIVVLAMLVWAIPTDVRRARLRHRGRVVRGPELMTVAVFNAASRTWISPWRYLASTWTKSWPRCSDWLAWKDRKKIAEAQK